MRTIFAILIALSTICVSSLMAGDDKPAPAPKAKAEAVPAVEMSLTGKLTKNVTKKADKAGVEKEYVQYLLTAADGTVAMLHQPKPGKDGAATIDLDSFVDQNVTVTGLGRTHTAKGKDGAEVKKVSFAKITDVKAAAAE